MKSKRSLEITNDVLINYAYGLLAPEVAMQVKHALEKEETLRWQYEGIVALIKQHPDEDPGELLEQMANEVGKNIVVPPAQLRSNHKSFSRRWLQIAAIVVLLAGIGTFVIKKKDNHSPAQLAELIIRQSSNNPYSNATRGDITPADSAVTWKDAFIKNDFDSVIFLLKNKQSSNNEEQFFLALAYLKTTPSQPEKAELLLQQLTVTNSEYTPDAWLYLGLAQALQNKKPAALQSLSHVEQTAQVKDLTERLRR